MNLTAHKHELSLATAFILSLVVIGAQSHQPSDVFLNPRMVLSGKAQASYEDSFAAANPLRDLSVNIWGAVKYNVFTQASSGALIGKNGWLFTNEELELKAEHRQNLMASVQEISTAAKQLHNRGIQLIMVILPDKARIYADELPYERSVLLRDRYANLQHALKAQGLISIDAQKSLNAQRTKGDMFMRDDTHWSPLGASLVANAIAAQVDKTLWPQTRVSTVQTNTVDYDGDLLRYIPTGGFRAFIGPEQSRLKRYETTVHSGAGLFGQAAIDVVLLGTSFSAKPEWHFEGFLKQALGADVLNLSQAGQGPFVPMRDFLSSDMLAKNPPKLVVWEIPERYTTLEPSK